MNNIKDFIGEVCNNTDSINVSESIKQIQDYLRGILAVKLSSLEMNECQKQAVSVLTEQWCCPIEWEIQISPVLCEISETKCLGIGTRTTLAIKDVEGIERTIDNYVESIKKLLLNSGNLRLPPKALVERLQKYLRDIRKGKDYTPQNSESRIHELLEDFFGMKALDYSPNSDLDQYFEPENREYIINSKTTIPAIIKEDGTKKIEVLKGIYVKGKDETNNK